MKYITYILSTILIATTSLADDASKKSERVNLKVITIIKSTNQIDSTKKQTGSSELIKDKKNITMLMDAQTHLKAKVIHTKKEGNNDEK